MTPAELRTYLRKLQSYRPNPQNDYFAWEKPDGTLFMIGIKSEYGYDILIHEMDADNIHNLQRAKAGLPPEYTSLHCSISPYQWASITPDPIERIVKKVEGYRYLGSWRDPDRVIEHPDGKKSLACGRWELAKSHILPPPQKIPLVEQISHAEGERPKAASDGPTATTPFNPPKTPSGTPSRD